MPRESGASSNPKTRISTDRPGVTGSPAFAGDDTTKRRGNDAIERSERRKRNTSAYASPSACAPPSHVGEAADGDADGAGTLCCKLKPAGGRHGKPHNFSNHGAKSAMKSAMPQSFLKTCQHRLLVSRFDIDDPVRREPDRSECRREQILAGHAPQHATPGPRGNPGGKECSGSAVDRAVTAASHFVQRPERQSAFRQTLINDLDAERQYRPPMPRPALKASNALAKRLDNGNGDRRIHALLQLALGSACSLFVLIEFGSQSVPPLNQAEDGGSGLLLSGFRSEGGTTLTCHGALCMPTLFHFLRSAAERYGNGLALPTSIHCRYSCFRLGPNKSHAHEAFSKSRCSTNDTQIALLMSALPPL